MKFFTAVFALISAVPFFAQGSTVPNVGFSTVAVARDATSGSAPFEAVSLLSKRAEDEWLMVIYNNGNEGDQCGGVANNFNGKESKCWGLGGTQPKMCADLKVGADIGFAKCDFSFRSDGTNCGGEEKNKVTVDKGKDNNGVKLDDEVRFVSVTCSE